MDELTTSKETAAEVGLDGTANYYKRDFWSEENLKFIQPHFRLEKASRLIRQIAGRKECNLLDVGCGPAALMHVVDENIHYYGIDIAIHDPQAPNLMELDLLESPIRFGDVKFDIVLAQGVFEYLGTFQSRKFEEISELLTNNGKFIVSYWNFGHLNKHVYERFSNIQSQRQFRDSLAQYFNIERSFPVSHNWHHHEPGRKLMKAVQMNLNIDIPLISPLLAVEYFFICSPRSARTA